ncbi:hypothetical protein D3C81_1793510 [compost metagenome]
MMADELAVLMKIDLDGVHALPALAEPELDVDVPGKRLFKVDGVAEFFQPAVEVRQAVLERG